jgi:hypothetical protein
MRADEASIGRERVHQLRAREGAVAKLYWVGRWRRYLLMHPDRTFVEAHIHSVRTITAVYRWPG